MEIILAKNENLKTIFFFFYEAEKIKYFVQTEYGESDIKEMNRERLEKLVLNLKKWGYEII